MKYILALLILTISFSASAEILIPMDNSQSNHLKAYGIAFASLQQQISVKWLLNYRGGSFLISNSENVKSMCRVRGVIYEEISSSNVASILMEIESENMHAVVLEKEPKIAIYSPPNAQPWDDAVTLALTYAEIKYDTIWDEEVLAGNLNNYDWLHLHHEDFTGQYGKFYGSFRNVDWYKEEVQKNEELAKKLGFNKAWRLKHAVAEKIRIYVEQGGFLFAMCAATDTFDIALATRNIDICQSVFDGDELTSNYQNKLDFSRTFAFQDFKLYPNPYKYEFSEIDASDYAKLRGAEAVYFQLFVFSA